MLWYIRVAEAEASLKEMEVARERGLLVSLVDFEKMMTDLVGDHGRPNF